MKLTKKVGSTNTIRKVWNDGKTVVLGVVGTVGDLLTEKLLKYADYDRDAWCYLSMDGKGYFEGTREDALSHVKEIR